MISTFVSAFDIFIAARAYTLGVSEESLRETITPEEFERQLRLLFDQWQRGDISLGRFTELIGVPHAELREIFDAFGLPRHN